MYDLLGIPGLKLNILLPHPLILQYKYIIHCTTIDSDDSGSRMSQYNNRKKKIKIIKWIWIFHRSVMDL